MAAPLLDLIKVKLPRASQTKEYPFSLPLVQNLATIPFPTQVTFFVGENGTGKSTILEAIAQHAGFGAEGGSKNISFTTTEQKNHNGARKLADCLTLSWRKKPKNGYFFRAESFFNIATYIDTLAQEVGEKAYACYGGKSLHEQSHGESFLAFFTHRLGTEGFFILDEPEAALSPQRQLSLLVMMHELCKNPDTQFIIATHSPLLLAYPGATIYACDGDRLRLINYRETEHYRITKNFLGDPEQYIKRLFMNS